jgi:cytochrome c
MRRQAFLISVMLLASATLAVSVAGRQRDQETKTVSGRTVWDGVYSEEQAGRGRTEYMQACASCHAEDLRGKGTAPSLVEESFWFLYGETTVGELWERIRTLMPSDRPNSLSSQNYRDIVAFILQSNKLPPGEKELDADPEALREILITMKRSGPERQSAPQVQIVTMPGPGHYPARKMSGIFSR